MKQNKLVIVVLIIIALLFVIGLGANLFRNKEDKNNGLSMSKAGELKNGWLGSMESAMAVFSDALDSSRLQKRSNCQTDGRTYKLVDESTCEIMIDRKNGAEFEKAVLTVEDADVKVLVPYPDDEACPETTRGSGISLKKFKRPQAPAGTAEIRPDRVQPGASRQPLQLSVVYIPKGGDEEKAKCEVTEDIGLTVLEEGGKLRLQCEGCNKNRTVTVTLK